jgi:hypothetical protein
VAANAFQPQNSSTDSGRERDVYAIYSLMLTKPSTSHGPYESERLLIAMTTKPPDVQLSCIQPPKDREAEFREVMADYEHRKTTPRQLKPLFSIPKPYMLLTDDEVRAFSEEQMRLRPFAQQDDRFRGVSDYFTLGDVYFNMGGTLAVTAFSSWCGGPCAQSQLRVFEKADNGRWVERQWGLCGTIAENLSWPPLIATTCAD